MFRLKEKSARVCACVCACACVRVRLSVKLKSITTEILNINKVITRIKTNANARWNHIRVEQ